MGCLKKGPRVKEFAKELGLGECTLWRWIKEEVLYYEDHRIPSRDARRIKKFWKKTCTPSEAARMLHVSATKISLLLSNGRFKTIKGPRKLRIFKKSIPGARKYIIIHKKDLAYPNRRGFARLKAKKHAEISGMGGNAARKNREMKMPRIA